MANQNNFQTDLAVQGRKFLASRVVTNNLDEILQVQVPATVPNEFDIEISLYSLSDNSLIYNSAFSSTETGLFDMVGLKYDDLSVRRLLFVDFSKSTIPFANVTGRYQIVINFFAREVGNLNSQTLWISKISPSKTEVELQLLPEYRTETNQTQLLNFAEPEITSQWIDDALKQIFNQPNAQASNIPTDKTSISYDIISSFFSDETKLKLENSEVPADITIAVANEIQYTLDTAYKLATATIDAQKSTGVARFTRSNLVYITSSSLSTAMQTVGYAGVIV